MFMAKSVTVKEKEIILLNLLGAMIMYTLCRKAHTYFHNSTLCLTLFVGSKSDVNA